MLRVLGYTATRDLIPIYGIYALLFSDRGLSAGAVSSLFVVWSITGFVFEIPSGTWADTYDRRRLLVWASLISAAGFAMWTVWPTYPGFAAGFALWGLSGAMTSGTFEALLYDELSVLGSTTAYPRLVGWSHAAENAAATVGILLGAPLFALGGYALAGWTSVAFAAVGAVFAAGLPDRRPRPRRPMTRIPSQSHRLQTRLDRLRIGGAMRRFCGRGSWRRHGILWRGGRC